MIVKLAFVFTILSSFKNLEFITCQPDQPHSNGPTNVPVFTNKEIYGVRYRFGIPSSSDYGNIPPNDEDERNRIVGLAGGTERSAGDVGVYELFQTASPARTTVNGFLYRVPENPPNNYRLLRRTAYIDYDIIKFERYLTTQDVAALEQAHQPHE